MESAVVTVSGYQGLERFNLIKFISHAGASYVGSLSHSTTHLICWKFEGRKYELAKKLKTIIVNHRWIEDCIKEGRRLPEGPYMLQSGEEMGPFLLQIHDIAKGDVMTEKREVLSDNSNVDNNDFTNETTDVRYGGLLCWSKSPLLDENFFPGTGKVRGYSHKLKYKSFGTDSKGENWSSRNCSEGTSSSGSARKEHGESSSYTSISSLRNKRNSFKEPNACGSTQSVRVERNISNGRRGTSLADSSRRKGRRLVKNFIRETVVSDLSDSDQECCSLRVHKQHSGVVHPSDLLVDRRNANLSEVGSSYTNDFSKHRGVGEEKTVDGIKSWNHQSPSKVSTPGENDDGSGSSLGGSIDAEKGSQDVNQIELAPRPLKLEESCVICLTEFSSTRGILPCVHRFCFSCIQKWADEMASRKKTPTCPLCLQVFTSITKVEDADICDKQVLSQTIPSAISTTDVLILCDEERPVFGAQFSLDPVCINCLSREPVDLLVGCYHCQIRYIHEYCLDPPLFPWTCIHCKDIERLRLSTYSFY